MKRIWLGVICLLAISASGCGLVTIEDGQTGGGADFGKVADQPLSTGWHWYLPMVSPLARFCLQSQWTGRERRRPRSARSAHRHW